MADKTSERGAGATVTHEEYKALGLEITMTRTTSDAQCAVWGKRKWVPCYVRCAWQAAVVFLSVYIVIMAVYLM